MFGKTLYRHRSTLCSGMLLILASHATAAPFAYIPNARDDNVSIIDLETNAIVGILPAGDKPAGITWNLDNTRVYVANRGDEDLGVTDNTITVIDPATRSVIDTFVADEAPHTLAVHPDGKRLYVATPGIHFLPPDCIISETGDSVTVVDIENDNNQVIDSIGVGDHPWGIFIEPSGKRVFVTNAHAETMSIIDADRNITTAEIDFGDGCDTGIDNHIVGLELHPNGETLYVTHMHASKLSEFDLTTRTITRQLDLTEGVCPDDICKHAHDVIISPDGSTLYVSLFFTAEIAVVDTTSLTVTNTIAVSGGPKGLDLTDDGRLLYAANQFAGVVDVIDTTTQSVIQTIPVGEWPIAHGRFIGNPPSFEPNPLQFSNVTDTSGLVHDEYVSSSDVNLGVCWIDVDNDDHPDLFATNGFGQPPHLYLNNGDGNFAKADDLLPTLEALEHSGCAFADYDNDGDQDIYIPVSHESVSLNSANAPDGPPNLLLKNLFVENGNQVIDGQPLFEDVAASAGVDGVVDPPLGTTYTAKRSMSASWLDYNRDGCVDLYVAQAVFQAAGDAANTDTLYRNNCDGTFDDVTATAGINDGSNPDLNRPALAVAGMQLNNQDIWPDLWVVNGQEEAPYHLDLIYSNSNGLFTEVSANSAGVGDDSGRGLGIDTADIDLDGDWDVYISDLFTTRNDATTGNVLHLGNGDGTFADNSADTAGVVADFSWGVNFLDADHDGYEDLFVATANNTHPFMYHNNRDGTFTNVNANAFAGFVAGNNRGSAMADYDNDGDLDLAVIRPGENGLTLYRNDTQGQGNYLKVKLAATQSNASAIGTVIRLRSGGLTLQRQVKGGSSAHSQNELTVHFGLADNTTVDQLSVRWPSGNVSNLTGVGANTTVTVTEAGAPADTVTITAIDPDRLSAGTTTVVTLSGEGFQDGATVALSPNDDSAILEDGIRVRATAVRMEITVPDTTPSGSRYALTVQNPDGGSAELRPAFSVR